ncbi:MAG: hypothetical protein ACLSWS_20735, partial [Faecalispora jeddahensis]
LGTVPQTDSKGVLWKAFATFRPFTKGSARPGTRGKLAQAETPCRGHSLKITFPYQNKKRNDSPWREG